MHICYSRAERKVQIAKALAKRAIESKPPASMRDVAAAIGMKPGGSVSALLWEMVDEGKLRAGCYHYRPGWVVYKWSLTASHYNVTLDALYGQEEKVS